MLIIKRTRRADETTSLIPSDRWTISMATAHVGYPVSKLKTDNLGDYARAYGQRRSQTRIVAQQNPATQSTGGIEIVGLLGINRLPATSYIYGADPIDNEVRLIIDLYGAAAHFPQVSSIESSSNLDVSLDIDVPNQVLNPPEEAIVGGYSPLVFTATSNTTPTMVTYRIAIIDARSLTGTQTLLIHTRDSINIVTVPSITATITQFGVDRETATLVEIEKTSEGYIFTFTWTAGSLPNPDEAFEVRVNGSVNAATSTVEYMGIEFRPTVSGTLFDTGFRSIATTNSVVWLPGILDVGNQLLYSIIEFSDFAIKTAIGTSSGVTIYEYTPLDEAFHSGRFIGGEALKLPLAENTGFNIRQIGNNAGSLVSSYGGQLRAVRSDETRWQGDFTTTPQSETRVFGEISQWLQSVGFIFGCLYADDTRRVEGEDATMIQHPEALWAILTSFEAPGLGSLNGNDESTSPPFTEDKYYSLRLSVLEAKAKIIQRI